LTRLADFALDRRIDALMAPWTQPGRPGAAVGVVRGGEILLRRGYGLASVEHGVPIGPATVFRIASVTKQFTTGAALLLAEEGRLDLDADVRTLLPDLPAWPETVRVRHLMHNSSGIRDMFELTRLAGNGFDRPASAGDLRAAIGRAGGLNFAPGTRFLYSNANFFLLGELIERIEGASLDQVFRRRFFAPLGMASTRLVPDPQTVVPGLATAYLRDPEGMLVRAHQAYAMGGEGGLVSCLDDLLLWARNYDRPIAGGAALVEALTTRETFPGGVANPYARGIDIGGHRGLATVGHGGLWPGYRTEFLRVPALELAVVAIANVDAIDPHLLTRRIVDMVLADGGHPPPPALPDGLADRAGLYLAGDERYALEFSLSEGQPMARVNGVPFALQPTPDGRLEAARGSFELTLAPVPGADAFDADLGAGRVVRMARIERGRVPDDIAGRYVSAELDAEWRVVPAGEGYAVHVRGPLSAAGPWPIRPLSGDHVEIVMPTRWLTAALVATLRRDGTGRPDGLVVSSGRIRDLALDRVG